MNFVTQQSLNPFHQQKKKINLTQRTATSLPTSEFFLKPNSINFQEQKYEKKSVKVGDLVYLCLLSDDDSYQEIITGDNQITQLLQLRKRILISPQFENKVKEFIFQNAERSISLKMCLFQIKIGQNYYFQNQNQNEDAFADLKKNELLEEPNKYFFEKISHELNRPDIMDEIQKHEQIIQKCAALEIKDNEEINNQFIGTDVKTGQSIQLLHMFSGETITVVQNPVDLSWKVQKLKMNNWDSNLIFKSSLFSQKLEQHIYYGDEIQIFMDQRPNQKFATCRSNSENNFITASHQACSFQILNYCDNQQFYQIKQQKFSENLIENGDVVFLQFNEFNNYICVTKKTKRNFCENETGKNFCDFLLEREICFQNDSVLKKKFSYLKEIEIQEIYQITVEKFNSENQSFQHFWEIHQVQIEFESPYFTQENYFTLQHVITGLYLCVYEVTQQNFDLGLTKNPNKLNCYFQVQASQKNKDFLKFNETFILNTFEQKHTVQFTSQTNCYNDQILQRKTQIKFEKPQKQGLNSVYQVFQIRMLLVDFYLFLQNFGIIWKENTWWYDTSEIINQKHRLNDQINIFHQTINFIQEYLYLDGNNNEKKLIQFNQQLSLVESDIITFLLLILNQSQAIINQDIISENAKQQIMSEIIFKTYYILKLIAQNNSQVCKYILQQKILNINIFLVFLDSIKFHPTAILEFLLEMVKMSSSIKQSIITNIFQKFEEITEENIFVQTCYIKILSQTIKNEYGNSRRKCQFNIANYLFSIQEGFASKFEETFFKINYLEEQFYFQFYPQLQQNQSQEKNFDVNQIVKDGGRFQQLNSKITMLYRKYCQQNEIQFKDLEIPLKFFIDFDIDKEQVDLFNQYEDYILSVLNFYSSLCQDRNEKNRNLILKNCNLSKEFVLKNLIEQNKKTTSIRFTTILINLFTNFYLDIDPLICFSSLGTNCLVIFPENNLKQPGDFNINNVLSNINVTRKMKKDKIFLKECTLGKLFCQRQANYAQLVRNQQSIEQQQLYYYLFIIFFEKGKIEEISKTLDFGYSFRYSQKQLAEYQIDFFSELLRMRRVGINLGYSSYSEYQNTKFILESLFFSLFPFLIQSKENQVEFLRELYTSKNFIKLYQSFCSEEQEKIMMLDNLIWNFQCCKEELNSKTKLFVEAMKILAIHTIIDQKGLLKQSEKSFSVDSTEVNILTYLISEQQDSLLKENIKKWWMQDLNTSLQAEVLVADNQLSILTNKTVQTQIAFFNCEDEDQQLGQSLADINSKTYYAIEYIKGKKKQQQKSEHAFKVVLTFISKLVERMISVDSRQYDEFINYQNIFRIMGGFKIFTKYLLRPKQIQGNQMVLRFYKKLAQLFYLFTKYNQNNIQELVVKKNKQEEVFESRFLRIILIDQKFIEIPLMKPIKIRKVFQNCQLPNSIQLQIILTIFNTIENNTSVLVQLDNKEIENESVQGNNIKYQHKNITQVIANHLLQINENVKILRVLIGSMSIQLIDQYEKQKVISLGVIRNRFFFQILQPDDLLRYILNYETENSPNENIKYLQYLIVKLHRNLIMLICQCCYKNQELIDQMRTVFNFKQILLALENESIPYLAKQVYLTLILELFISEQQLSHKSFQIWTQTDNIEISILLNNFILQQLQQDKLFLYLDGIADFGKYKKLVNKENLKEYINKLKADRQSQNFTIADQKQYNNGIIKSSAEFWKFLLNDGLILFLLCLFDELVYAKEINFNYNNKQIGICLSQIKDQLQILIDILLNLQHEIEQNINETSKSTQFYISIVTLLQKLLPTRSVVKQNTIQFTFSSYVSFHSDQIMLLIHFIRYHVKPKNILIMYHFYKKTSVQNINLFQYFKISNYFFYLGKEDISKIIILDKELLGNFVEFVYFLEKILEDRQTFFSEVIKENLQIKPKIQKRNLKKLQEQVKVKFNKVFNQEEMQFRLDKFQQNFKIYQHFYTQFCTITQNKLIEELGEESIESQLKIDVNFKKPDAFLQTFEKLQHEKCVLEILTLEVTDQQTQEQIFEFVTKLRDSAQGNMVIAFFELIKQNNKALSNFTNLVKKYLAQQNLEKEDLQNYKQNEKSFILFLKFLQLVSASNNFFIFVTENQNQTQHILNALINFIIVFMNYDHTFGFQNIVFQALKTLKSISSRNQQNSQMIVKNQKLLYMLNQQILQSCTIGSMIELFSKDNLKMISLILKLLISLTNFSQDLNTIINIINFIDVEFLVTLSEIFYQLTKQQSIKKDKSQQKKLKGVGLEIYIFCFLLEDKIPHSLRSEANNLYMTDNYLENPVEFICSFTSSFLRLLFINPSRSGKVGPTYKKIEPEKEFIQKTANNEKNYLQKVYFCHRALKCLVQFSNSNQFYRNNICVVEVVNEQLKLEKVYFKKPEICNYLSLTIKEHIIFETKRDDNSTRLNNFLINSKFYYRQMKFLERIFSHSILKFGILMYRMQKKFTYLLYIIAVVIIILQNNGVSSESSIASYQTKKYFQQEQYHSLIQILTTLALILNVNILIFSYVEKIEIYNKDMAQIVQKNFQFIFQNYAGYKVKFFVCKIILQFVKIIFSNFQVFWILSELENFYNLAICILTIYAYINPFVYSILLLDIVKSSKSLQNIIRSITLNGFSLLKFTYLGFIFFIIFGFIAFTQFQSMFNQEKGVYGFNLIYIITTTINLGLRNGGGIGDTLDDYPNPEQYSNSYWSRYFFDLFFFITFNILFIQIIFGVIIDTFGELRQQKEKLLQEIEGKCFICGMSQEEIANIQNNLQIDLKMGGFYHHIYLEHNIYHMLSYISYLREKKSSKCNSLQKYIQQCIQNSKIDFFPQGTCILGQEKMEYNDQ